MNEGYSNSIMDFVSAGLPMAWLFFAGAGLWLFSLHIDNQAAHCAAMQALTRELIDELRKRYIRDKLKD